MNNWRALDFNAGGFYRDQAVLCTIKAYESGLVIATPAFSTFEPEECDDNDIFLSSKSMDQITSQGSRLTTYTSTLHGYQFEYSIECSIGEGDCGVDITTIFRDDADGNFIKRQNNIHREENNGRRDFILKDYENSGRFYVDCDAKWTHHACIEIVSASGFFLPNAMSSVPHGFELAIKYRVLNASNDGPDAVVIKGNTNVAQSSPPFSYIEFTVNFFVVLVVFLFVSIKSVRGLIYVALMSDHFSIAGHDVYAWVWK